MSQNKPPLQRDGLKPPPLPPLPDVERPKRMATILYHLKWWIAVYIGLRILNYTFFGH